MTAAVKPVAMIAIPIADLQLILDALTSAPVKYRIDFDAYWIWWEGPRARAVEKAKAALATIGA